MITTEPTDAIVRFHDRMPAVLVPGQIGPFLDGDLRTFGPSDAALQWRESANFLKGKKGGKGVELEQVEAPPRPSQGELF